MTVVEIRGPSEERLQTTVCGLCGAKHSVDYKQFSTHLANDHTVDDLELGTSPTHSGRPEIRCDGGSVHDEIDERGCPSENGMGRWRQETQVLSPPATRQKSASPQVHSGAIPIGLIVPSALSVAGNTDPQERHFAKHRGAGSCFDIAFLETLCHISKGTCDITGNWIEYTDQSLATETDRTGIGGEDRV